MADAARNTCDLRFMLRSPRRWMGQAAVQDVETKNDARAAKRKAVSPSLHRGSKWTSFKV